MKKIILCSLVAMMAVTAANAEIASVEYVGNTADLDTTEKDDFTVAINELVGNITDINTELGSMATSETVTNLTTRVGTAETEIDALQAADGTIRSEFAAADATTLQSAKDYADGLDAAQKTALEQGLATKQDTIDDLAAIRSGATAGATALQSAKDYADGLDAAQKTAFETADSEINAKIGTVAEGKTVVQMIAEAQSTATYDDAQVKEDIAANTAAIATTVKKEQVGIGESFAISDDCKAADAVCSLVVRAGVAGWEKIRY